MSRLPKEIKNSLLEEAKEWDTTLMALWLHEKIEQEKKFSVPE